MKRSLSFIAATAALLIGAATMVDAASTTVVTETHVKHRPWTGADIVDYRVFDVNGDGTLAMTEVGEKLFYVFDKDGNQLIDNIEFDHPMVMTFAPMERQTFRYVDYNSDGVMDETQVTSQRFLQETGLSRFSGRNTGLSASAFIERPFKRVDRDWSGQIDIREWKEAYIQSLRPMPQNDSFRYNR